LASEAVHSQDHLAVDKEAAVEGEGAVVQSLDAQGANLKHAAHCTALGGLSLIAGWAPVP
jgi:hypothetical protein